MKKLLAAMLVALLTGGCGGEAKKKQVQEETKDDTSVPLLIPCEACGKQVSKKTEKCLGCGHPASDSVVAYKEEQELARIRTEEARIKAQGGPEALARIREAEESGATKLDLTENNITDLTPLAGLTKLEILYLWENWITDVTPLAGLTKLKVLELGWNYQLTDITPLAGLTNLKSLVLARDNITDITPLAGLTNLTELHIFDNPITDISPLAKLTALKTLLISEIENPISEDQKAMLRKALPDCEIHF